MANLELPIVILVTIVALSIVALIWRHAGRSRFYRSLSRKRREIVANHAPKFAADFEPKDAQAFADAHIVRIGQLLDTSALANLQAECLASHNHAERSYIPKHKKGGTLSYEAIHRLAPACLALYHSTAMRALMSRVIGTPVQATADHDQSSCSLLYYDQAGDHIGWHYDYNFYRGRHFTVLVSLINRSDQGGLSKGRLQRKSDGEIHDLETDENTLVLFEGAKVFHRATAIGPGEQRIMLSMTFCTEPHIHPLKELMRRIKDTAYYGPRVLFD